MQNDRLTFSLVQKLVIDLGEKPVLSFGLPFTTNEGCVLITGDNDALISNQPYTKATGINLPFVTNDGTLLISLENTIILGA
tara:strand:+ start:702 stop:947 length:246 start_codon:yes stop_codon:yes gene_type:complete